jgi:hypothetical protein
VHVHATEHVKPLSINKGKPLSKENQKGLFQPFMLGENAVEMPCMGLLQRMLQRILISFGPKMTYTANMLNNFSV